MESLALAIALAVGIVPVEVGPVVDKVHAIERNWTYDYDTGRLNFVQLIFWELGPLGARQVRDYRIIGDSTYDRSKEPLSTRMLFMDKPQFSYGRTDAPVLREIQADLVLESVTPAECDPERADIKYLPSNMRTKLMRRPTRVRGR